MTVHEEVSEQLQLGNKSYAVVGSHRDWNPMKGYEDQMPEGTVWELMTQLDGSRVVGVGSTKDEAIRNLIFQLGFRIGVNAATRGPNR